jgi:hypothetical protein
MAVCRNVSRMLVLFSLVTCSVGQDVPQRPNNIASMPPMEVSLNEASAVEVPSLPAESIGAPLLCGPDGRILFRLATPEAGVEDPVSVSKDGKTVIRFGREKINDIPRPLLLSIFLLGTDVYIITTGSTPLGSDTKWRTPTGKAVSQPVSKSGTFIAHFEGNGNYAGAVRLDLPFKPQRLGVFENGDFLVSGAEPSTDEPRVAIVASNGQLRRLVELKGDVHAQEESGPPGKSKEPTALPRFRPAPGRPPQSSMTETLSGVVSASQIARDGPNLLLFRPINGPVFSISPSGEVRIRKLKVEGSYRLYTIKAAGNSWIVEFLHDVPHSAAVELSTYAFDPDSGAPLREYFFPTDLGWGLACTDGDEFTFVIANQKTNTLKLVTLAPAAKPN